MSKYRYVDTKFWNDGYIINLLPDEKLLFLYFITSPLTNIAGIYECPLKVIASHTGFDKDVLEAIFERFKGKIHYVDGWVYIRNFIKHQSSESVTVKKGIEEALSLVPPKIKEKIRLIEEEYGGVEAMELFSPDAFEEEVKEEMKDTTKLQVENVAEFYQEKIKKTARITKEAKDKIRVRLKEFTEDELLKAIINFSNDPWRMENNTKYPMVWFFRSNEQVEKWLLLKK